MALGWSITERGDITDHREVLVHVALGGDEAGKDTSDVSGG